MKKYIQHIIISSVVAIFIVITTMNFASGFGEFNNSVPVISTWQSIVNQFGSGSCSGYLKSDGTCSTASTSVTGAANITSGVAVLSTANITTLTATTANITQLNTGSANITGGNITVNDFLYMSVDAGIDTPYQPSAASKIQGNLTAITVDNITAANAGGAWTTFTAGTSGNITSAASSDASNATITFSGLTVGKLIHYKFTPTLNSGAVPNITVTSGASSYSLCTLANATACDSYFMPTSSNVTIKVNVSGASNFSIATTTGNEYSRAAIGREYAHTSQQCLLFDTYFPYDWNAGTINAKLFSIVSNATAPANLETVIYSISGFCVGSSDSLNQAMGTSVNAIFTADATYAQYDEVITNESGAVTLTGAGAGKKCRISVCRPTSDTYAQPVALTGMRIRFNRTLSSAYGGN
ncbi:MAG: hypothetical protein WC332_00570 [Clostridia bacterium]|jgi:hypothetical protein